MRNQESPKVSDRDRQLLRDLAQRYLFGDILPVHESRSTFYPLWGGSDLSEAAGALFGLTELMYILYDKPELAHALMTFMRDAVIANLKQGEAAGDWSYAEHQDYFMPPFVDTLPDPKPNSYGAHLKDLWFFTHAHLLQLHFATCCISMG